MTAMRYARAATFLRRLGQTSTFARVAQGLLLFLPLVQGCRPDPPTEIPLPTSICIQTQHHFKLIKDATVYLKYNVDSFPGYDHPASYYDASFRTGSDARGCIAPVPEGRHWLIAFGKDSLYVPPPYDVFGNLPITISLNGTAKLDTVLYVSEKH